MREDDHGLIDNLYNIIAKINSPTDCKKLFEDMCTYKEIEQMAQRIKAAELLMDGMTYAQVIAETDISSATLSRVSKCIHHGAGGYKLIGNTEQE